MDDSEAVERFLEGRPDSVQLAEWRATLEDRLRALRQERDRGDAPRERFQREIRQLEQQIGALREEEAITGFVEDSVRVTLRMGSTVEGMEEEE